MTNVQAPMTKQIPMTKYQRMEWPQGPVSSFIHSDLVLVWSLVIGAWSFPPLGAWSLAPTGACDLELI
jgi:hypothetical protein